MEYILNHKGLLTMRPTICIGFFSVAMLLILVMMNCFTLNSKESKCDVPYSIPIGMTVEKTMRILNTKGIKFTQETKIELERGIMTASNIVAPKDAAIGLTYIETTVTNSIFGVEESCLTIIWFDQNQETLGVSRFERRSWL